MFWTNFEKSCTIKGMTPAQVAKECGIGKSNVSLWKNKGYVPRSEAISSLAEYLGVTVDYLLGNEKSAPTETGESAELTEEQKRLQSIMEKISRLSEKKLAILDSLLDTMLE